MSPDTIKCTPPWRTTDVTYQTFGCCFHKVPCTWGQLISWGACFHTVTEVLGPVRKVASVSQSTLLPPDGQGREAAWKAARPGHEYVCHSHLQPIGQNSAPRPRSPCREARTFFPPASRDGNNLGGIKHCLQTMS